jgi:uncharacterized protein (TIRG00374 family)
MNRKQVFNVLRIVISISLLAAIFYIVDLQMVWQVIRRANLWWLAAAFGMMILGVVIRALRWQILLKSIDESVSLNELTQLYFISFLFNNLIPTGMVGGDAIRMLELSRQTERGSDAVTSVVVDRYLGLLSLQAIALLALLTNWNAVPSGIGYFTVAIFLGGLIAGYLLLNRPLYLNLRKRLGLFRRLTDIKFIGNLFESFQRYPLPAIGRAYVVGLLFNITLVIMYTFIGRAIGMPVSLVQFAIIVPITSLFLLLPSFAGIGWRELSFQIFYQPLGVSAEMAVAMSLLVYFIGQFSTGVIGGVIYLIRGARGMVTENHQSTDTEINSEPAENLSNE